MHENADHGAHKTFHFFPLMREPNCDAFDRFCTIYKPIDYFYRSWMSDARLRCDGAIWSKVLPEVGIDWRGLWWIEIARRKTSCRIIKPRWSITWNATRPNCTNFKNLRMATMPLFNVACLFTAISLAPSLSPHLYSISSNGNTGNTRTLKAFKVLEAAGGHPVAS